MNAVTDEQLHEQFVKTYGIEPEIRVTCPGRVNLIGEHIDYHDYGVFPMAIDASTVILAARNSTNNIVFSNFDPKYTSWESPIPCPWQGSSSPKWSDYLLCGWKGILDFEKSEQFGISFLLYGTIPPSSGLSSSSSLVCVSALATLCLIVQGDPFQHISRENFAHLCAKSEPLIGTLSGGMDQAAEVLASEGTALRIDFNPLRSKNIELPENAVFVVVHSNTELNKGATSHYNERVIEGRIVAQILKREFSLSTPSFRLKDIQTLSGKSFEEILKIVEEIIPEELTKDQVIELIGNDKLEECLTENTRKFTNFKLRSRARHVFSEAHRVELFESACESKDIKQMGVLMNASHRSCAIDYECSCEELDAICELYTKHGALGARLTGAGWGGCAVVLMAADDVANIEKLPSLFVSKPGQGIRVHRF
ncbi:Protein CBR-TAG-96 [Caenorhabditis briggsae]|uniref:Protein CBR-TAG-96 n=3 Tax=Caenorhabditis briggsae TaxID=6238 RepID=A8Y1T5_CAEBR|nr:Protein CBR-TAG-96 [Caenorhabditis briggsae]ULU09787.1 hypothetical protein L3Y34_014278 [Caenorhabditis briggsae]CAP38855.2 Protein CBR-TAG-96 [Caenorhabditis briggsae]